MDNMEKHYCINCGQEASELHHVVPLALGGNDIDSNKVWLCNKCHNKIHKRGLGMGQLAAVSPNFRKAVEEGRVGRPKAILPQEFYELYPKWKNKEITATDFMKQINMPKATFYKKVKEYELILKS